jgi:hypothetical protein
MLKKQVYYCRAIDVNALTQTGTKIRFYYALSDPTLCTDAFTPALPPQNTVVAEDRSPYF